MPDTVALLSSFVICYLLFIIRYSCFDHVVLVVFGLVYVPMPPTVYAVCKDCELAVSINDGESVEV